jgi:hypothetical protein
MFKPRIQTATIDADNLTRKFELGGPDGLPDNIHVGLSVSAMSASETLNITGRCPGIATYITAVLVTEIDINAAASTVITVDLSAKAPVDELLFTATNIAGAEEIDIVLITW